MNKNQDQLQTSANTAKMLCRWLAAMTLVGQLVQAASPGTAFTYQGRLFIGDVPANGLYDLQFTNYDAAAGGNVLGGFNTNALPVTNGLFTVTLDFGAVFDGTPRWLEISERTNSTGAFATLAPRQLLAAAPYATYAASAGTVPGLTILQNSSGAPNVIGGSTGNWVASGVVGATIAGGGATNYNEFLSSTTNSVSASFGTIGGGDGNTIQVNANEAAIGGGVVNTIQDSAAHATIGGGFENTIQTNAAGATIGGGVVNTIQPNAYSATIGGGDNNAIQTNADHATIGGGDNNVILTAADRATIGGGSGNTIQGSVFNMTSAATIGGGEANTIQNDAYRATIGGGEANTIESYAMRATIGGGNLNVIQAGSAAATIGGGSYNTNQAGCNGSTIGGGGLNVIQANTYGGTIGGGDFNTIQPNGWYATIPGGYQNSATTYAFAAGTDAQAIHSGAFVWADHTIDNVGTPLPFSSTANNQFAVRAGGGARFITSGAGLTVDGPVTAMAFNTSSDRNLKEHLGAVKPREVLDQVASLPIWRWNFKADAGTPHIGPTAQDFYAAFSVGSDDRHIATVDADGVALAAIQGLNQKLEETRAENADLRARLEKLERLVQSPK